MRVSIWKNAFVCRFFFCYGDEENARIHAVHLATANQSGIRGAYLVSVGWKHLDREMAAEICMRFQLDGSYN